MDQRKFPPDTPIKLPYGDRSLEVEVHPDNLQDVLYPKEFAAQDRDEVEIIREALEHPIGSRLLSSQVHPGQRVAIVTSDLTRPCPSDLLIPPVLDELMSSGVLDEEITIVIGLGVHRPMSEAEIIELISPEIYHRIRVINHDPNDTIHLGVTSRGTPVELFRPVVEADIRICLGVLEFHYFAGYSGGAKAILPGCASRATITSNHSLMIQPGAGTGRIEDNPLRLDLEEGVAMLGVDFILNVVMENHHILGVVAGDLTAAHRKGCELIAARGKVPLPRKADIVIASPGGYPKDINLFQAHKALENASCFVREGGALILVAECREGLGNDVFEKWMLEASSPSEILERFRKGYVFGGHKAARIANTLKHNSISLVSSLPDGLVKRLFLSPFPTPPSALEDALVKIGPDSQVLVLPQALSTIPE
jgi:nickel-dependent lactate racemase